MHKQYVVRTVYDEQFQISCSMADYNIGSKNRTSFDTVTSSANPFDASASYGSEAIATMIRVEYLSSAALISEQQLRDVFLDPLRAIE